MILKDPVKILDWRKVEPIFKFYISVWSNHISLNWAILAWQYLHKGGLTVYNTEKEELKIRSYAVALSLIYYEYCHRTAFSQYKGFIPWTEDHMKELKNDFLKNVEEAEDLIFRVRTCISAQVDEYHMNAELWINCAESYHGSIFSVKERTELYKSLILQPYNDFNFDQGLSFIFGNRADDISYYESLW